MTGPAALTGKVVSHALAAELVEALHTATGRTAAAAPSSEPDASAAGWLARIKIAGDAQGVAAVWFSRDAATAVVQSARALESEPTALDIGGWLQDVLRQALTALATRAPFDRLRCTVDAVNPGVPSGSNATALDMDFGDLGHLQLSIGADVPPPPAPPPTDERLAAVLDVDLPLVVRFGTAVVPLKVLAGLAAGSLVEMNRSPDDPVDLLVGDRVIARGDVVVVDGHYGVRITELTSAVRRAAGVEA